MHNVEEGKGFHSFKHLVGIRKPFMSLLGSLKNDGSNEKVSMPSFC